MKFLHTSVMFSLLYGFWQALFRKVEFHILLLGLDRAGKTSLLEQLKGIFTGREPLPPGKIPPTVGLNIGRMQIKGRKVLFWDLGGQTGLRAIWEKYYAEAHGLVYVVDAAEPERFDESRGVLQTLMANPEVAGAPLLLLANKQDAEGAVPAHEVEARLELPQLLLQSGHQSTHKVLGVSALTGDGIQEGVLWMVEQLQRLDSAGQLEGSSR